MHRWCLTFLTLPLISPIAQSSEKKISFEHHIRPILKAQCFHCHGEGKRLRGGLDLRLRRLLIKGGKSGSALIPGSAEKSLIIERIRDNEMPPGKKKLTGDQIQLIAQWIDKGAATLRDEPEAVTSGLLITEEDRAFWAFQPIRNPPIPEVSQPARARNPVDHFILTRLEKVNQDLSEEAGRAELIRRATFDLHGLPPSPEEVLKFLNDDQPGAYERLLDRLLASPRYGERWVRHWLDIAGYADSEGVTGEDTTRPYAYKYRDYVVQAFNNDKPWDLFIQEQLAGDEIVKPPYTNPTPDQQEKLIATGFLRMAPDGTGSTEVDQGLARNQVMAETLKIVSTSLLGLTVGCAQCHHHRYDPIAQEDYYRMRAIFEPALNWKKWRPPGSRRISLYTASDKQKAARIEAEAKKIDQDRLKKQAEYIQRTFEKQLAKVPKPLQEKIRKAWSTTASKRDPQQKKLLRQYPATNVTAGSLYLYDRKAADDLKKYAAKASNLRASKPKVDYIRALTEPQAPPPPTFLFRRGDHEQPGEKMPPSGLSILNGNNLLPIASDSSALPTTGRRLAFAHRLTNGNHPLTARVLVNRVWMHHFGRGIVNTPGDFGALGERPTHPDLLDWLASRFMAEKWRLKPLHRRIMLSATYRQSSHRRPQLNRIDPENRLFGRMSVRRLEAEAIRDAILDVSGQLLLNHGGKPVPVTVDQTGMVILGVDTRDSAGRPTKKKVSLNGEQYRRSIYIQVRRSLPLALLETFDAARPDPNCEKRSHSTVAPQALLLMNSEFMTKYAKHFAQRVRTESGPKLQDQIRHAWRLAFAKKPARSDLQQAELFIQQQGEQGLSTFCQALLSSNRFLYID